MSEDINRTDEITENEVTQQTDIENELTAADSKSNIDKKQLKREKRLAKAEEKARAQAKRKRKKVLIIVIICVFAALAGVTAWQMSLPRENPAAFLKSWLYKGKPTSEELERVKQYISEAYTMFDAEKYDNMIDSMNMAIKLDPTNAEAYLLRGYAYTCKFDFDASLADYEKSLSLAPNNYTVLEALGDFYFNTQDFKKSEEYYSKSIENTPDGGSVKQATEKRIMAVMEDGRYEDAIALCEDIYSKDSTDIISVATIGDCYYKMKNYEKALEYYSVALVNCQNKSDNDNMIKVFLSLGSCYTQTEDYELAIQYLTEYISKAQPASLSAYYNRGIAYFNRKDYDNAVKDFTVTIGNEYEVVSSSLYRGLSYKILMNYEKALADILVYMESNPDASEYYMDIGNLYVGAGDTEEAEKWYKKCIDSNVNLSEAEYSIAFLYFHNNEFESAVEYFTKCIEKNYNKDYSVFNRGMSYYMLGEFEKSRADMEATLKSDSEDAMKENARTIIEYIDEYLNDNSEKTSQSTAD